MNESLNFPEDPGCDFFKMDFGLEDKNVNVCSRNEPYSCQRSQFHELCHKNKKWLSTVIKKKWMSLILSGTKGSEYKTTSEHWNTRIKNLDSRLELQKSHKDNTKIWKANNVGINFLCGQISYKFIVTYIFHHNYQMEIDGVMCSEFWEIKLGARIQ